MKFLYPEFLWAFALLIVPIIIHLFNFKRYKTLYFSSLTFVKHVDQKTKSTQTLKHLLVLASRILAFIFLVLAFAQPYFTTDQETLSTDNQIIAFYLDNSFSMQARGAEGELLSEARENAREIIKKAPLDTRFIIGTNDFKGTEERLLSRIEAFEKLDEIDYTPIARSVDEVVEWQNGLFTQDEMSQRKIQYVLFSDFQRSQPLSASKEKLRNVALYPVLLRPENETNIYIDSVWFTSPVHKINANNELNIRVGNHGNTAIENSEVQIEIGDYKKTIFVELPANQKVVSTVSFADKTTGIKKGRIHTIDDHVLFDDSYYISYEVRQHINVLLLNGEDAVDNIEAVLGLDDYYNVTAKTITQITKNDFNGKDIVFINGSNQLSTGIGNYLTEFSETGGSLALFPGTAPVVGEWNKLLNSLRLSPMGQTMNAGTKIGGLNFDDPFFKGVFETKPDRLNLPSVSKVYRTTPNASSVELIELQNGNSLFSYNNEAGNNFMFYGSLDSRFGNFTRDALFSTIILRMCEMSQRSSPLSIIIGDESRYPIYAEISDESPIHIKNESTDFIPPYFQVSGTNYLSLSGVATTEVLKAGNYDLFNNKVVGAISLNYDGQESLLGAYSASEITEHFAARGIENIQYAEIGNSSQLSTIDINKPFSYWKICIILTLIFVCIEMLLIRFLK